MKLRARKQFFVGDTSFGFSGKEASPTLALYISSPGLIGLYGTAITDSSSTGYLYRFCLALRKKNGICQGEKRGMVFVTGERNQRNGTTRVSEN